MPKGWLNLDSTPSTEDLALTQEQGAFEFLELTRYQRLLCFGGCVLGGFIISLLGAILLITGSSGAFAVLFALGGLVSLAGTGFLIGFKRQWKLMWKPVRYIAAIVMLLSIVLCFITGLLLPSGLTFLCIFFVVIQYLAMLWYSLSYVPYARAAVKNGVSRFF